MEITFYLAELLKLHDCVIIPDLGGFVTNYRPAEMDLARNSFNPPLKEIIFTGKLSKNDGLLVNYISEIEGVGYMEARQIISEFVDEAWSKLENGEKIEFQNIGSLQFDRNEKLIFESEMHENFLLEAYGMDGFQFPQLERAEIIPSKRLFNNKEAVRPVFNVRKVKALAIGIPILLALIFVPVSKYSLINHSNSTIQSSSTASIPLNSPLVPSSTPEVKTDHTVKAMVHKSDSAWSKSRLNQVQPEQIAVHPTARYRLIGGCFKQKENADKFLEKLRTDGFKSELKILPNGTFLVIAQSYTDKSQALTALSSLRNTDPKAGYWMSVN